MTSTKLSISEVDLDREIKQLLSENEYVQTKIPTKYGDFFVRVYKDIENRETLVLWSGKFDNDSPPLVRVHSECMTGDLLGSLKCDCGQQLHKSLRLIHESGGILIYLRQEGRGIGLFEKIKAYQLQHKGFDTFEANVLLGHGPDERSYKMVKTVLDDFCINRIRLLTNNPSKISEIAQFGINVEEQVSLYIEPNKHNWKYYQTKKKKFQHIYKNQKTNCFYQFHVDNSKELETICNELPQSYNNPLLKLCVGISTTPQKLGKKQEQNRIKSIYDYTGLTDKIKPILHISFKHSKKPIDDLDLVKHHLPFVNHIHINDLENISYLFLRKSHELFATDLPLSNDNFEIINNPSIRKLLIKNQSLILIDNSKGSGKKESFNYYKEKIDCLLNANLYNIALCGGFGPNEMEIFFAISRYYKINFSVDAESKLKTNQKVDPQKTLKYLNQLTSPYTPNVEGVTQTKTFLEKNTRSEWESTHLGKFDFMIHPQVFHAGKFPSSKWYAEKVSLLVSKEQSFCEVGCGSGIVSCMVALKNPHIRITATDINVFATENTAINAKNLGVSSQIRVINGDVLDSVPKTGKFDSIFWAMPFGFLDSDLSISLEEMQVFDPGYRSIYKFFQTAKKHLNKNGRLLIGFSDDLGHRHLIESYASEFGFQLSTLNSKALKEETNLEFLILEATVI